MAYIIGIIAIIVIAVAFVLTRTPAEAPTIEPVPETPATEQVEQNGVESATEAETGEDEDTPDSETEAAAETDIEVNTIDTESQAANTPEPEPATTGAWLLPTMVQNSHRHLRSSTSMKPTSQK